VGSERGDGEFDASVERELLGPVLFEVALDVGAAAADDGRLPLVGGPRGSAANRRGSPLSMPPMSSAAPYGRVPPRWVFS